MFDTDSLWFLLGGSLLGLGGIFLVQRYFQSLSNSAETGTLLHDQWLYDRMQALGIQDWGVLRQKLGFTRDQLSQVRRGEIGQLKYEQLSQLAAVLGWSPPELLKHFEGFSNRSRAEIEALREECLRLREQLRRQDVQVTTQVRQSTFGQLQTLLTNYPSIRQLILVSPDLPAKNLTSLFTPLDNLLVSWGYEPIGVAWEQVSYDPQLHQPDSADIVAGESVYIRFIGYREGEQILCPAKVSRTLPKGIK